MESKITTADLTGIRSSDWEIGLDDLLRLSLEPLKTQPLSDSRLPESVWTTCPGKAPFVRGSSGDTYAARPWTVRQYAGFGSARETNQRFKWLLARGQTGISVAFDLPTQRGFDSDAPEVVGEVGRTGVAIDSVDDFKVLLEGISLRDISVSMTINSTSLPILAAHIVAAEERGYGEKELRGTIQNDPLKEYIARNTYVFPPRASLFLAGEVIRHCTFHMPKFHPISVSGYHFKEMGANPVQEVSFMIANGLEYIDECTRLGISVERVAPKFSFFLGLGTNVLVEAAKLRAARFVWATLLARLYRTEDPESRRMRMHCQTSGVELNADMILGNIGRVTLQALAAILGGAQSLHTNGFDEALGLPSQEAEEVALQTQEILREEAGLSDVMDPLGGAYYVEALTKEISDRCTSLIVGIRRHGGMMPVIENGWAKRAILISAIKHQAHLDGDKGRGHRNAQEPSPRMNAEMRNHDAIAAKQKERLSRIRKNRDGAEVERILARMSEMAAERKSGLMEVVKECVRARATIGEISAALARSYGEYRGIPIVQRGVYAAELEKQPTATGKAISLRERFDALGGPPRLLVAKLGQDGHDRGASTVASALADIGWNVAVTPLFSNADEVLRHCSEADFDILGISTLSDGHDAPIRRLFTLLKSMDSGRPFPIVVCGGVISPTSSAELLQLGVARIFGPGSSVVHINSILSDLVEERRRRLHNQIGQSPH
jgi:methylmalonyl-CoA mutase